MTLTAKCWSIMDELVALKAENATLRKALKPFSDCVFYDNGDATVSYGDLKMHDACVRAYFAMRRPSNQS